jgi:hypothetical protein
MLYREIISVCQEGHVTQETRTENEYIILLMLGRAMSQAVSRRPLTAPGSVHVGFVVDKVALGQVFPRVRRFFPVNFITPVLHYTVKWKMKCSSSSQGCTISFKAAVRP